MQEQEIKRDMAVYLLSREDIGRSFTSGKSDAHAHHAGFQLAYKYYDHPDVKAYVEDGILAGVDHFNTCITLHATKAQIENIVSIAKRLGYVAEMVIDTSYPYWCDREVAEANGLKWVAENGPNVLLLREELTFGQLLGDRNDPIFRAIVGNLSLKDYNKALYTEKK
jgi:hypothetical protein